MDRLAQGVTNRAHRCTETEDQRIQDSHSQPHARFSTFFLRGTDEYRPVAAGARRPQPTAAVSPRWRGPKQFSRPRGCTCAARSFQLAVVVSFRFTVNREQSRSLPSSRLVDTHSVHRSTSSAIGCRRRFQATESMTRLENGESCSEWARQLPIVNLETRWSRLSPA